MKLVRDKTEQALSGRNMRIVFDTSPKNRRHLLFGKIMEEALEWLTAEGGAQEKHELADCLSVLRAMAEADGIPFEQVLVASMGKDGERGGFKDLVVLDIEADGDEVVKTPSQASTESWPKKDRTIVGHGSDGYYYGYSG